ncbi:MAG: hypothetical protein HY791_07950 [Deltaproteobacteria bacterium]|nr:hypothetical protein [Deltaproteobacteria bacterium]
MISKDCDFRQRRVRRVAVTLAAVILAVASGPASGPASAQETAPSAEAAEPGPNFEQIVAWGMERFLKKDYRNAINIFYSALEVQPEPNLIFNIARCHEYLGEDSEAIKRYQQFVANPASGLAERVKALGYITGIQAKLLDAERIRASTSSTAPQRVEVVKWVEPPQSGLPRWVTWSGLVASVALGGVSVWSGFDAKSAASESRTEPTSAAVADIEERQGRTNALVVATAAVGVVTLVVALLGTNWQDGS